MTVVFIGSEHIFEFHPLSWDTDTEQNGSIYLKTKGVWKSIKQPILPSVSQDGGEGVDLKGFQAPFKRLLVIILQDLKFNISPISLF